MKTLLIVLLELPALLVLPATANGKPKGIGTGKPDDTGKPRDVENSTDLTDLGAYDGVGESESLENSTGTVSNQKTWEHLMLATPKAQDSLEVLVRTKIIQRQIQIIMPKENQTGNQKRSHNRTKAAIKLSDKGRMIQFCIDGSVTAILIFNYNLTVWTKLI